jgi:hypothetical protein
MAALLTWGASKKEVPVRERVCPVPLPPTDRDDGDGRCGAWLTLLLAGMWRRAHTWIDKLGIAVEPWWIALDVFAWEALCVERSSFTDRSKGESGSVPRTIERMDRPG